MEKIKYNNIEFYNIKDYPDYYVSRCGKIFSNKSKYGAKPKILKAVLKSTGYYMVSLCKNSQSKNILLHRLVAQTFLQNPKNKSQVNHKDLDKSNNNLNNLEWNTSKENIIHSHNNLDLGKSKRRKVKQICIKTNNIIKIWDSIKEAQNILSNCKNISNVCVGKRKTCGGFKWEYL